MSSPRSQKRDLGHPNRHECDFVPCHGGLWYSTLGPVSEVRDIFVPFEPQIPFDYAQGGLSTPLGAKNAPNSAQDDIRFWYGLLRHHPRRKNKDAPGVGTQYPVSSIGTTSSCHRPSA